MKIKSNQPVFPVPVGEYETMGITIRQFYAGLAMQGLLAFPGMITDQIPITPHTLNKRAVEYADALIAELNKTTIP